MLKLPEQVRTFIAVSIPPGIVRKLRAFQETLERKVPKDSVRWSSPEQLHLTLKFLGSVPSEMVCDLQSALERACAGAAPLRLRADAPGAFPSVRRPRVLWVGISGDLDALLALQQRIDDATLPWTQKAEKRPFHPHVTLGRVRETANRHAERIGKAFQKTEPLEFGSPHLPNWEAAEVHLVRSQLSPKGSIYTTLATVPLRRV